MVSNNLIDKLIRVERTINIYNNNDNSLVEEIEIDFLSLSVLKQIVLAKDDDPFLYDGYILDLKQLEDLNKYLTHKIEPDFETFFYILESAGIYDWEKK
jgi:hypothetical protein